MLNLRTIRLRDESGQSMVETGLVMTVAIIVIFWVFEICMLLYTYAVISDAAHEGVRYAIVRSGGDSAGTQAQALKFARISMHNVDAIGIAVTFPDGSAAPPNRVRVTVTYTYIPIVGLLGTPPTMRAFAEGRMVVE